MKGGVESVKENMDLQMLRALAGPQGNDNLRFRSQEVH